MIDLHCHLLPNLDDGAIDVADAVEMARVAERDQITAICTTPHIRHDHDVDISQLDHRVVMLNDHLRAAGVGITALTGGEVAQTALPELDNDELRTVSLGGGGRWILLEPQPGPLSASLVEDVDALRERGFRCVVAHPERHPGADFQELLEQLARGGALIQVTAALIADSPASETMLALAQHGLVHLVASDAHSSHGGRPATISAGLDALRTVELLTPHMDWIAVEGPRAIVAGDDVRAPFGPGSQPA